MNFRHTLLSIAAVIFSIAQVYSQEQSYVVTTNRPNQTDAVLVMAPGFIQLESGFGYQKTSSNFFENRTFLLPTLQLRFGIVKNFELNIFYDYNNSKFTAGSQESTINDNYVTLGSKYHLWKENGLIPEAAAIFNLHYSNRNGDSDPLGWEFRLILNNSLSEKLALKYMLRYRDNLAFALNPSYTITDNWSAFFEYYSDIGTGNNTDGINLGLGYLVNSHISIDFMYGKFFEPSIKNYLFTIGLGWWIK